MPRLVGKRSNSNPALAFLFLVVVATGISLEYFGYIDVVPEFSQNQDYRSPKSFLE